MDLTRGTSHDYVDNPYWSIFEIKVKQMAQKQPFKLMDKDLGKVSSCQDSKDFQVVLVVNLTLEESQKEETEAQLTDLQRILKKYQGPDEKKKQLAVYGQFSYDVLGGESMTNRELAQNLIKR